MTVVVAVRWARPSTDPVSGTADAGLDRTERWRLSRLRTPADRSRFVTSRRLLKGLVAELSGVDVASVGLRYECPQCGEPHGKPWAATPSVARGWSLSIAHAGDRVAVAASRESAVGVDVEPLAAVRFPGFDGVALTGAERARLATTAPADQDDDRDRARAAAWVAKEAVLKAKGVGLAREPATFEIDGLRPVAAVLPFDVGAAYAAAVAVLTDAPVWLDVAGVSEPVRSPRAAPARRATNAAAR